ncbi:MAG TPA: phage portal protein, partial [Vicinamibacterales bacterium]|nr:phage portal protein [Vicinamibacterales bacterium]
MNRPGQWIIQHADGSKTAIQVPWLTELQYGSARKTTVRNEPDGYLKVPAIFHSLRMRCDGLTRVPLYLWQGDEEVERWPFEDTLTVQTLLWTSEAAILLHGASYFVRLIDANYGGWVGLQPLNPFTVNQKLVAVTNEDKSVTRELRFWQQVDGKRYPTREQHKDEMWPRSEMFYLRDYNPTDDVGPGTSAASVALMSTQVKHYISRFAAQFFENGAMPVTMLQVPEGTESAEKKRVEDTFRSIMQGVKNAFRLIAYEGTVKPEILTPELKSMELEKLTDTAMSDIASAFGIPKTLLTGENANYAEAEVQKRNFIQDTIA